MNSAFQQLTVCSVQSMLTRAIPFSAGIHVREDAQGIRVIKALSKIDYENRRYDMANKKLKNSETKAGIIISIVNPIMTLLMNMGIVAVIGVSAYFVSKNV